MAPEVLETKLLDIMLSQYHLYLLFGIVGVIYLLSKITPIATFLFSEKWKWLIVPLNLILSFFGVFVLKLTEAQETRMKLVFAVVLSMLATATYEWLLKHVDSLVAKKLGGGQ